MRSSRRLSELACCEPDDWVFPSNRREGPMTRQENAAQMAKWGRAADVHLYPTVADRAMPHTLFSEVWTSSPFKPPWGIRVVQRRVITSLATLGIALLCGWADH